MAEPEPIPEHVEAAAIDLLAVISTDARILVAGDPSALFDIVAHSILSAESRGRAAQREADARVVEDMALVMAQGWESTPCSEKCMASTGLHNAGFFIAAAIRKQENKT